MVPLGLLIWVAFSLPLAWNPLVPYWAPHIQVLFLLLGLYYALKTGSDGARRLFGDGPAARRGFAPVAVLLTIIVIGFLPLYVG